MIKMEIILDLMYMSKGVFLNIDKIESSYLNYSDVMKEY
jgi:hypothetical protein